MAISTVCSDFESKKIKFDTTSTSPPPLFSMKWWGSMLWTWFFEHWVLSCRWETAQLWLSRSLRPFKYSSYVYSCHLLISSASAKSFLFLSFIMPIWIGKIPCWRILGSGKYSLRKYSFVKYSQDSCRCFEEISSLSHSIVFLYFFVLFI